MAGASRRGYGEDGIYFDHRADCRDSAHHKTCVGRWRGVVSLGFDADGKRIRKKVSGQTRTEVKDKLKSLHSELDAGVRSTAAYTVEKAVADWLAEGLPGRTAKTVEVNRDSLRPAVLVPASLLTIGERVWWPARAGTGGRGADLQPDTDQEKGRPCRRASRSPGLIIPVTGVGVACFPSPVSHGSSWRAC